MKLYFYRIIGLDKVPNLENYSDVGYVKSQGDRIIVQGDEHDTLTWLDLKTDFDGSGSEGLVAILGEDYAHLTFDTFIYDTETKEVVKLNML